MGQLPWVLSMTIAITSPCSKDYNCIAWAAEDDETWWWPNPLGLSYWPLEPVGDTSLQNFINAYSTLGYERCEGAALEAGFKKVALYMDEADQVAHAARQLDNGEWTSKLGPSYDIRHPFIEVWQDITYGGQVFNTAIYGKLAVILRKQI